MTAGGGGRRRGRGGGRLLPSAVLLAGLLPLVAGCGPLGAAAASPSPAGPVLLEPTPWPAGTVGPYGLRVDPALLRTFPATVSGEALEEAADLELQALDDQELAASFDAFAAARVGGMADPNWLVVSIGRLSASATGDAFYNRWRDDYASGACSQAGGVASTTTTSIGDWTVDVASCTGGVDAYTFRPEEDLLVSITDLGPRRLGRQLVAAMP